MPSVPPKRAVILAAGRGRRLMPHTQSKPKCLLDVGGISILEQQIRALREAGIDDIVVVTGFAPLQVHKHCPGSTTFVHNHLYASTNSIYSLWLAREYLDQACLIMNADVLFGRGVLSRLLINPMPDVVVYDSTSGRGDEETKVRVAWHGRLVNIGKGLSARTSDGEYLGLMRLSASGAEALAKRVNKAVTKDGVLSAWVPVAVKRLLSLRPIFGVDVAGEPWIEIDFIEDLERARAQVYPRLAAADGLAVGGARSRRGAPPVLPACLPACLVVAEEPLAGRSAVRSSRAGA